MTAKRTYFVSCKPSWTGSLHRRNTCKLVSLIAQSHANHNIFSGNDQIQLSHYGQTYTVILKKTLHLIRFFSFDHVLIESPHLIMCYVKYILQDKLEKGHVKLTNVTSSINIIMVLQNMAISDQIWLNYGIQQIRSLEQHVI